MEIITPKDDVRILDEDARPSVFLAGGMGKLWRKQLIEVLGDADIIVVDPSVDDWEKTIGTESNENLAYVNQVNWEQSALYLSDISVFHFDEKSLAPISLFELGTRIEHDNVVIHLEDGYEKSEYVKIIAAINGIPIVKTIKELASLITILSNRI